MLRATEKYIASGQKRVTKIETVDSIQTAGNKYKRTCYFMLFLSLCIFGFASYIISFQSAVFEMAPIAQASLNETITDLKERNMYLTKTCMDLQLKSRKLGKHSLYVDKSHGLLFCIVPKCGSSYWLRFFQALTGKNYDPFTVIRFKIHRTQVGRNHFKRNDNLDLNEPIRLLVTRSPYSRLYSAYVDKLFLPEFWYFLGTSIIKQFRENATNLAKSCGNDLTFSEFLKMVTYRDRLQPGWANRHWRPIEQLCSPCRYKYNYIIKEETLFRDRNYLVSKMGIKDKFILNYNDISHWDYCLSAIKDLCHTIFIHFRNRQPNSCYKIEDLLQKLFTAFQIQGYIREDALFDLGRFGDLKQTDITRIVEEFQKIYTEDPVWTRHEWQEQRKAFRKKAYKLVDVDILEGIKKCYELDFKIFNYDPEPEEIFGNRTAPPPHQKTKKQKTKKSKPPPKKNNE